MEATGVVSKICVLELFLLSLRVISSSSFPFHQNEPRMDFAAMAGEGPSIPHDYARFPDVERQCRAVLSSATELPFDANRANALKPELSFVKGDWRQDSGNSPLIPFDGGDAPRNASGVTDPLALASFTLTHVDAAHRFSRKALNVSGVLGIAISRNGTVPEMGPYIVSPEFKVWPGSSELKILVEGVYTETEKNSGERVLCLVGNAMLPSRGTDPTNPWAWAENTDARNFQPPVTQDENVMLVVRYPKSFALASRAVRGELTSLHAVSNARYFDKVQVLSQLGAYSNYEFGSDELVSTACRPYPHRDDVVSSGVELYKGAEFCGILDRFTSEEVLAVVPNWNCKGTDALCRRLGPFETDRAVDATDGGFADVGIVMQEVRCKPRSPRSGESWARVSAVFRAVPPWEHRYTASQRTGLGRMTLSAEGVWKSSTGQLCMVGCRGLGDGECHSRICLYVPTTFSATRRSVIFGRITSIDGVSHFPLSFERTLHPSELWARHSASPLATYEYTKIEMAGAFLERSEPFDFGTMIAKSLLSYPKKGDDGDDLINLSNLAEDLTLHVPAVPEEPSPRQRFERPFLQLEILSVGALIGRYGNGSGQPTPRPLAPVSAKDVASQRQLLLNVSAELTLSGTPHSNVSVLNVEGVYNPVDGRMYTMGCRDVRASWRVMSESTDLEDGLDCLIEVKVEYPPTTARWLINPTAKIFISSRRDGGDPLHFNSTRLQTLPILYREQRQDILSRRSVEGTLRILTLSAAIGCEFSQLFYMKANADVMPYVSLVMLGVQALGYSVPLITGAEALFARLTAASDGAPSYEVDKSQRYSLLRTVDCLVKVLILAAFLLTLRLGQKVWRSRIRLLTRAPLEPGRVPDDKKVFLYSFGAHAVGFLLVLLAHYIGVYSRPIRQDDTSYMDSRGNSHALHEWAITLQEYIGLVQDFFLLPQIIGNVLWRINCRPLKKTYYVGITAVRLLPHVYDYIRSAPVINPYFSEEYEFVNTSLDFYSQFGDVAIPLMASLLMVLVYVQQRWNYRIISRTVKTQRKRLQHLGSRVYERLPSMSSSGSFEAELVSGVNEAALGNGFRQDAN